MTTVHDRYRVYPNVGRARSFNILSNAIRFADRAFLAQGLADLTPISIVIGSGMSYRRVGTVDVYGFHEDYVEREIANIHARIDALAREAARLGSRGLVFAAADVTEEMVLLKRSIA